jgi:hypothetical protein
MQILSKEYQLLKATSLQLQDQLHTLVSGTDEYTTVNEELNDALTDLSEKKLEIAELKDTPENDGMLNTVFG